MKTIQAFLRAFTRDELPHLHRIGSHHYQIPPDLAALPLQKLRPYSIGLFLGQQTPKGFQPSLALLEWLAKHSQKKCVANEKGEWLFLCKRDLLEASILSATTEQGLVLVQNEHDENLGYGEISRDKKGLLVRNMLDRGNFLRREPPRPRHKKRK